MNKEEFFEIIDKGITVVDFFVEWCAPCKGQTAVFNYLKKDDSISDTKFIKFDVDRDDQEITESFEIRSIPTIVIFKDGEEEFRFTGITGADQLTRIIKKLQLEEH
jgi:thioredoxin 1